MYQTSQYHKNAHINQFSGDYSFEAKTKKNPKIHIGAWGLPDFGITEAIGNLIGTPKSTQGGSNILGPAQLPQGSVQAPSVIPGKTYGPYPTGSVQGAKSSPSGSSNNQPTNNGGGGGGQTVNIDQELENIYSGALDALNSAAGRISESGTEAIGNLKGQLDTGLTKAESEGKQLADALSEQGRQLGENYDSAYADAIRHFQALTQQGLSKFGLGSSAGRAVGELANQEFLRQQGGLQQTKTGGEQQLGLEHTKLNNYVQGKRDDLDNWFKQEQSKVNDWVRTQLSDIDMRKGDVQANKARDKMNILQGAIDAGRQMQSQARDYALNLTSFAVDQAQKIQGRTFTPQEIAGMANQTYSEIVKNFQGFGANGGSVSPKLAFNLGQKGDNNDELNQLIMQ